MAREELLNRVIVDPAVCAGMPCIRGTRIYIAIILDALAEGLSPEEIIDHYPSLKIDDIRAAVAYAAELARENLWKIPASWISSWMKTCLDTSRQVFSKLAHDVVTVEDEGLLGKSDVEGGASARAEGRMLFTLDLAFADLRKFPPESHPGVVLFRPHSLGPLAVNDFIVRFARESDLADLAECVAVVEPEQIRLRRPSPDADPFK
jgi:uncharacterized protein (DUF433 family)